MGGDWRESSVAELQAAGVLLVEDGNHGENRPRPDEFSTEGIQFIRAADMDSGRVLFDRAQRINEVARQRVRKGIGAGGDVLLSHKGTVGKVAYVPLGSPPFICSPQTTFWRVTDTKQLDRRYIYFYLRSRAFREQLDSRKGETDMADYVSLTTQRTLKVAVPPLAEQKAIASVLGALDDKIELNRRMNVTLEAMARALFQSWFVDFDPVRAKLDGRQPPNLDRVVAALFPDSFQESAVGPIPHGWNVKNLAEIADLEKGLSYKGDGLADEGGMPMVNLGCFTGRGSFNADRVKRYKGEYRERHLVHTGDLVIANTDMTQNRVIIGSPAIIPALNGAKQFLFTHHVFAIRFKPGAEIWRRYVFFTLLKPEFREIAEGFSTGTTVLALPRDGLMNYSLCLPPTQLLEVFERQIEPLLAAVDANLYQSRTLATLRDTLLPKLLSGELRVSQAS